MFAGMPGDEVRQKADFFSSLDRKLQMLLSLKYRELAGGRLVPEMKDVEFRSFSQNGEDGILLYIFSLIGTTNRKVVEICAADGIECNSGNLIINHGWSGLLFDGNQENIERGRQIYAKLANTFIVPPIFAHGWITAENVNQLIESNGFSGEIDLLSLDLDGNDFWVWNAINCIKPRVVVLEYNAVWRPDRAVSIPYDPDFVLDFSRTPFYCGASLAAFVALGRKKGYRLVACEHCEINAFFVRNDLVAELMPEIPASNGLGRSFDYDWGGRSWVEVADFI
jgi:hypothetical protein